MTQVGCEKTELVRCGLNQARNGPLTNLAMREIGVRLNVMNDPVDIRLIEGRQRAEDLRRLVAGEVTPEQLQRENAIVQCAADILYVDYSPKGTPESWARIIHNLEHNSESI